MTDLTDFQRLVYEPETKALCARIARKNQALRDIAQFIEERHKEGDTEYQVAIIAREALRASKEEKSR